MKSTYFISLLAFIFLQLFGTAVQAQTVLSIIGTATTTIEVDSAHIITSIETQAKKAFDAQNATANGLNKIMSVLDTLNATKVNTDSLSLSPLYNYTNVPSVLIGYTAVAVVSFDILDVGNAIDAVIANGVTGLQSITFKASDANYNKALEETRTLAVQDATKQADVIASALLKCFQRMTTLDMVGQVGGSSNNGSPLVYSDDSHQVKSDATTIMPVETSGIHVIANAVAKFELDVC
ncbi:hypothetical protein BDR26DRAFT_868186 [Obelidium mucronatum]|nr:hypothetical protein BDR26DRAFT_868186 [Obelidium mucronatum]